MAGNGTQEAEKPYIEQDTHQLMLDDYDRLQDIDLETAFADDPAMRFAVQRAIKALRLCIDMDVLVMDNS